MPTVKDHLIPFLNKLPYIRRLRHLLDLYETKWPPGHYYSPIVDANQLAPLRDEWLVTVPDSLPGIDLREQEQEDLLQSFATHYKNIPFQPNFTDPYRYYYENELYSYGDAFTLYAILHHFRPKRIIEIGSGFTSALMLDANEFSLNHSLNLTFIEPYPEERLDGLLRKEDYDQVTIIKSFLQTVPLETFDALEANDVLFVDSTHVVKAGSDVNRILFDVLPRLKKGVLIHFHDIFYPFDYPPEWVFGWKGFGWNESYVLRAFLMYNPAYEIVFFNSLMHRRHRAWYDEHMPKARYNPGGSFWLRKK